MAFGATTATLHETRAMRRGTPVGALPEQLLAR